MAQVHKAVLKDGRTVAVKVQHKDILDHSSSDVKTMEVSQMVLEVNSLDQHKKNYVPPNSGRDSDVNHVHTSIFFLTSSSFNSYISLCFIIQIDKPFMGKVSASKAGHVSFGPRLFVSVCMACQGKLPSKSMTVYFILYNIQGLTL